MDTVKLLVGVIFAIFAIMLGVNWLKEGLQNKESGFVTMGVKGKITKKLAQIYHFAYAIMAIIGGLIAIIAIYIWG